MEDILLKSLRGEFLLEVEMKACRTRSGELKILDASKRVIEKSPAFIGSNPAKAGLENQT